MTYFARLADKPSRRWQGRVPAAIVASLSLHLLALFVALALAVRPDAAPAPLALSVRMLEAMPLPSHAEPIIAPPAASALGVPPRKFPAPRPAVQAAANTQPATLLRLSLAATDEPGIVDPRPEAPPTPPTPPAPFLTARFAAEYLNTPEPAYPAMSRRFGEQGRVVLSVRVSARGSVLNVEINQSSGLARLDDAAIAAVEQWRFVPARLGGETIESVVLVPLRFSLSN